MKYLIISAVGDESLHTEWITEQPAFDLALLYYGTDPEIAKTYAKQAKYFVQTRGMKYHLIQSFIRQHLSSIIQYQYIWMPDNDVSISTKDIHRLFQLAEQYDLQLCQPAMTGYISHPITQPDTASLLRYSNFVEVLAPLMSLSTLLQLYNTFNLNHSGWGYDYVWPFLLGYPKNKIAIIDAVVMKHTKPIGADYSRFPKHPKQEMKETLKPYGRSLQKKQVIYSFIPAGEAI